MASRFKKKRYVAVVAITAFVLLVALAPFLLSTSTGLRFVLSSINGRIPGTITVESWLVGWQQGILCRNVVYRNPDAGIRVTVPGVTTTQGLLQVVLAPMNLGLLVFDAPVVELARIGAGSSAPAAAGESTNNDITPWWNRIMVVLQVRDGVVKPAAGAGPEVVSARGVNIDADLQGGVVHFTMNFHPRQRRGTARVKGRVNLPALSRSWLDTLIAELDITAIELDVHDYLTSLAAYTSLPAGDGILNADLHLKTVGLADVQLRGVADFSGMNLRGGFLGEDTPTFQKINLTIGNGRWSSRGWNVDELDLVSDPLTLRGSGQVNNEGRQLAASGVLNLPVLLDQFPHLFKLRDAVFVERGLLDFDFDLEQEEDQGRLKLRARIDELGGIYDGRAFAWDSPVKVLVNGGIEDRVLQVPALRVDAPFLHVEGRGDFDSFSLSANVDFQKAFTEIGRLFRLEWDGAGVLELSLKGRTPEVDEDMLKIESDIEISRFTLNHGKMMVVPLHQFTLTGSAELSRDLLWGDTGTFGLQVALSSWLGEIFLVINGEKPANGSPWGYYTTDTTVNLDSLSGILHAFDRLPATVSLAGDMVVQAAGNLSPEMAEVREFNGEIGGFVLVRDNRILQDRRVRLRMQQACNTGVPSFIVRDLVVADNRETFFRTGAALNQLWFGSRGLFLHDLEFSTSQAGTITLDRLHVFDWAAPFERLDVDLEGEIETSHLSKLLRGFGLLPDAFELAGPGRITLTGGIDGREGSDTELQPLTLEYANELARYKGVEARNVALNMSGRDRTLKGALTFGLNGGQVNLEAEVDLTGPVPAVRDPAGTQLLDAVALKEPFARVALAQVSPLFGVLAYPAGTLSARLDRLVWPLKKEGDREASYELVFDLDDVSLAHKGVLRRILQETGLAGKKKLVPVDRELRCAGKDGQVRCAPLKLAVSGAEITVSGTVGPGDMLNYLVEVPVTGALAGGPVPASYAGQMIRVAITGTTGEPDPDLDGIRDMVENLRRQGAPDAEAE